MKTAYGKLMALALVLLVGIMLLAPMRAGIEDILTLSTYSAAMNPGESLTVVYHLQTETAQTVAYSSSNPTVAEVDQRGIITAIAPGKATVRLRAERGASAEVAVEVLGTPVTSFALNTKLLELEKGEISGLSCIFNEGASDRRVEWISANQNIVRVDHAGRVTAVGAGETYVIATTPAGFSAATTVRVNVRGTAMHITPSDLTVGVGATFSLGTYYLPEDTTDTVVSWRSSHPDVLVIDNNGMARAVSAGTATVTAVSEDGLVNATTVTVERAARYFQINPLNVTIERGDSYLLDPWFVGVDGERTTEINHHIEWTSADPSVASVENGVITGVSSGVTYITASADGFSSRCAVRVQTSVHEVTLNMTELYLLQSQTSEPFQLKAAIVPADADNRSITFSTNNPMVASVSQDGLVTMTGGYGSAVITCTSANGAQANFAVHVVMQLPEAAVETSEETQLTE